MIKNIIFDIDGVFTDGSFYYTSEGKVLKRFGSHDAQAIKISHHYFNIHLISADQKGFAISKLRADHMELPITLVPEKIRNKWILNNYIREETALVVDSFTDIPSIGCVSRSFAPKNSHPALLSRVSDVLSVDGGSGAVAEVLDILTYEKMSKHLWDLM